MIKFKKWMVYFINPEGHRDGNEYIEAAHKEDAIDTYVRFLTFLVRLFWQFQLWEEDSG